MPQEIDRDRLEAAAGKTGIYPGSLAYRDLLEVVKVYEADPPERVDPG
jgi:hypothetical protein